jgi:antitoxin component YwqK of YwqJK toxin-antitoxin module
MRPIQSFTLLFSFFCFFACASGPRKPCTDGGQPPREKPFNLKGDRQCTQRKDRTGKYVNDGEYTEWYPNGARALLGEYREGKKTGKWIEWDESGKKLSERWFEDGVETPTRETQKTEVKK